MFRWERKMNVGTFNLRTLNGSDSPSAEVSLQFRLERFFRRSADMFPTPRPSFWQNLPGGPPFFNGADGWK
ncbi:MAG: hypothetical protein ACTS42_01600 [Candidatus Hodgkinia cicadicola]